MIIEDKGKITLPVATENSGTIMTTGTEAPKDKVVVEEGNGTEVKVKVMGTEAEVADGIHMTNILPQVTSQIRTIKILTTTALCLWVIKLSIPQPRPSTQCTYNNTQGQVHLRDHNRHQMSVNYARALAIMITSASSLVTSCREHKKLSTKADHIVILIQAKQNGRLGRMITKTPMTSLFSKGGSSCC